jgi:hypothetical protein
VRSDGFLGCSMAALVCLFSGSPPCRAQCAKDFRAFFLDASAGRTGIRGADQKNFGAFNIYQAGVGLAPAQPAVPDENGQCPPLRHWNLIIKGDFMYGQADLKGSPVQQVISSNPQNTSLLSATTGNGKFYSATLGPRVQHSWKVVSVYGQVGLGWLRRTIDLTGTITEGTVLQPNNPSVFVQSGNSGALRGTFGIAAGGKGVRAFVDIGLLQGFAINHGTLLAPMVSGGVRW